MKKHYPHIQLPSIFSSKIQNREINAGTFIPAKIDIDITAQKQRLLNDIRRVVNGIEKDQEDLIFTNDKKITELKLNFYNDYPYTFINKYDIKPYKIYGNTVVGNVSINKLGNESSALEQILSDIERYSQTNELKSYFQSLEDIQTLDYTDIVESSLLEKLSLGSAQKVDIIFDPKTSNIMNKMEFIKELFGDDEYLGGFYTEFMSFCRVEGDLEDIKKITSSIYGISSITQSPSYGIRTSSVDMIEDLIQDIKAPIAESTPVIMFDDGIVKPDHFLIENAIEDAYISDEEEYSKHATAVASLIINGINITRTSNIEQKNKIIPLTLKTGEGLEEDIIKTNIINFASQYNTVIANLSINDYGNLEYDRSSVHNLTMILDNLAHQYNVIFFISTGNLFTSDQWTQKMTEECISSGYPNYFEQKFTNILPPADSINNITVGSIALSASYRSVCKGVGNPAPHTRKNSNNDNFIKPDLVHYDGNMLINSRSEWEWEGDGPYMASIEGNKKIERANGTSFSTPLCTHIAGELIKLYPNASCNTIKGLMIHFSNVIGDINDNRLVGHGIPEIDSILYSYQDSSTILIENTIKVGEQKNIKFPIPESLQGLHRKRLKIKRTLVYNPPVNTVDHNRYNPIKISCKLSVGNERERGSAYSQNRGSFAREGSNVKKYNEEIYTTNTTTSGFRAINVWCVCDKQYESYLNTDFEQKFSIILNIEDTEENDNDIHQELVNQIHLAIDIPVQIDANT